MTVDWADEMSREELLEDVERVTTRTKEARTKNEARFDKMR